MGINTQCKLLCNLNDGVKDAHHAYQNLSWVEWVDYATMLSESIAAFADAIVGIGDSMNDITADAGSSA